MLSGLFILLFYFYEEIYARTQASILHYKIVSVTILFDNQLQLKHTPN